MNNKAEMQTSESGFGRSTSAVGTRLTAIFNVNQFMPALNILASPHGFPLSLTKLRMRW